MLGGGRGEDLHFALLGVGGAEGYGAVAVLGEGLASDDVPDYGNRHVGRGAIFCLNTAAGTHWPAIRADWGDEEEVGAVERPFVPRYELVGEEDCFGDTGRWEGWRFPAAFAPLDTQLIVKEAGKSCEYGEITSYRQKTARRTAPARC